MRTTISKWGNSLAVRLPREAAASAGLREGAVLDLTLEDDSIVLRPRRWDIGRLVKAINDQAPPPLLDDEPVGTEEW